MKSTSHRVVGGFLIAVGVAVAVFSQEIVFPGLERSLGIETIVGRENVIYQPDGSYIFTNPRAMVRWISTVRNVGVLLSFAGALVLFREHRKS